MIKRIIVNLLLSFIINPLILIIASYTHIVIFNDNKYFTGPFSLFLKIAALNYFLMIPLLFSILRACLKFVQ